MRSDLRLYHFTCSHAAKRIGRYNCLIVPQIEHPLLRITVSWFTTEAEPDREKTGLTANYTSCDRMAFRYVITNASACRPWLGSVEREQIAPASEVETLESLGDPEHWWISGLAVPAALDPTWWNAAAVRSGAV